MGWVVNDAPRPLYLRERPGTHCTEGWVGPRAGLDRCGKSRPPPGFDPRTVQPVASRHTDCAIPSFQENKKITICRLRETMMCDGMLDMILCPTNTQHSFFVSVDYYVPPSVNV